MREGAVASNWACVTPPPTPGTSTTGASGASVSPSTSAGTHEAMAAPTSPVSGSTATIDHVAPAGPAANRIVVTIAAVARIARRVRGGGRRCLMAGNVGTSCTQQDRRPAPTSAREPVDSTIPRCSRRIPVPPPPPSDTGQAEHGLPSAAVSFADLGLPEPLVAELARAGIHAPFDVQAATIPDALAGRDVLGGPRQGRARHSPSGSRCWPESARVHVSDRAPSYSPPLASWPNRSDARSIHLLRPWIARWPWSMAVSALGPS